MRSSALDSKTLFRSLYVIFLQYVVGAKALLDCSRAGRVSIFPSVTLGAPRNKAQKQRLSGDPPSGTPIQTES